MEHLRNLEFRLSEMRAEMAAEPDLSGYDVALAAPRWRPWVFIGVALLIAAAGRRRRWLCRRPVRVVGVGRRWTSWRCSVRCRCGARSACGAG